MKPPPYIAQGQPLTLYYVGHALDRGVVRVDGTAYRSGNAWFIALPDDNPHHMCRLHLMDCEPTEADACRVVLRLVRNRRRQMERQRDRELARLAAVEAGAREGRMPVGVGRGRPPMTSVVKR